MSKASKYTGFAEQPVPVPGVSPDPYVSTDVDLVLKGWNPGLNKVCLTKTLRAGGIGLNEASKLTGKLFDGLEIRAHLGQFSTVTLASAELAKIGVAQIQG